MFDTQSVRRGVAAAAVVVASLLVLTVRPVSAQIRADEYGVKAAFLFNLAKFVQWPPVDSSERLDIGVIGDDFFGTTLDHLVRGKRIQGRELVVRRLRRDDDLRGIDIVFVASREGRHVADILSRMPGTGILTVGETPDFLNEGGAARFYFERNRMRVEVDGLRAANAGLKISSQLLSLAGR